MDKRDSDHFILNRIVCESSDNSYNSTLVTVGYQLHFLVLLGRSESKKLPIKTCTHLRKYKVSGIIITHNQCAT